jgi:hypothetical protein
MKLAEVRQRQYIVCAARRRAAQWFGLTATEVLFASTYGPSCFHPLGGRAKLSVDGR